MAVALVVGAAGLTAWGAGDSQVRKIVVFREGVVNEPAREALVRSVGGVKIKDLNLIGGKAVLLPSRSVAALEKDPRILRVDDDVLVEALGRFEELGKQVAVSVSQSLPWGIDRIDAELVWGATTADAVKVGVIDTGIELAHPDLAGNIKGGYNAINAIKSWNDDNGHAPCRCYRGRDKYYSLGCRCGSESRSLRY